VLFLGSSCAPPLALFVMSVMLTEPIVIENVRPVEGSRGCVVLDAQMYVFSRTGPHWPLSILQHRRDQVRRRRPLLRLGARLYFSLLAAALSNRTQIARPVPGNLRPDRTGPSGDGTGPTDDYNDIVRNFTVCGDFVRLLPARRTLPGAHRIAKSRDRAPVLTRRLARLPCRRFSITHFTPRPLSESCRRRL